MELKNITFQDIVEAKVASEKSETVDPDFSSLDLVKDENVCFDKFDDNNWKNEKTVSVEFDNFIFNSLLKSADNIDVVFPQKMPLHEYQLHSLKLKTDDNIVNKFEGKSIIPNNGGPPLASDTYRPFCFYPDSDQKLSLIKKTLLYPDLSINIDAIAEIKVYDLVKRKYHNANGARAIINNLLKRDNLLNSAVFPE